MTPPDARGWAAIGLFVTFLVIFAARASIPALAHDDTVNGLLTGLEQGAILAVASFYFGSSKQDKPPQ